MADRVGFGPQLSQRTSTRISSRTLSFVGNLVTSTDDNIEQLVLTAADNKALCVTFQLAPPQPKNRFRPAQLSPASQRALDLAVSDQSLMDHVARQIPWLVRDRADHKVAFAWLETLEPSGWTQANPGGIARVAGCSHDRAAAVLHQLQNGEPSGLFARSLAECLSLQLTAQDQLTPAMEALLANLPMLADGALTDLAEECRVSSQALAGLIRKLRGLNPKPGASFGEGSVALPSPEMHLCRDKNGDWKLQRHEFLRPTLSVRRLPEAGLNAQAATLIKAQSIREDLIFRIARRVIKIQSAFLNGDSPFPVPLSISSLAEQVNAHETTVGRIRKHLTIGTEQGRFRLESLLFPGVHAGPAGTITAFEIRQRIAAIVAQSQPKQSDRVITEQLAAQGVEVARRTVAKYRRVLDQNRF